MTSNQRIQEQAVSWVIHFALEPQSEQSNADFHRWFDQDERHRKAYLFAEKAWSDSGHLKNHPAQFDLCLLKNTKTNVSVKEIARTSFDAVEAIFARILFPAAIAVAVVIAAISWWPREQGIQLQRFATRVAEVSTFTLPDGSEVTLGAQSEIIVGFSDVARQISLNSGDAFFDVAADANRAFLVDAGDARVKVLGTQFEVQRAPQRVRVGVAEGAVSISTSLKDNVNAGTVEQTVRLAAGQTVSVLPNSMGAVTNYDAKETALWRLGELSYEDASLAEVVADANRYTSVSITLSDPKLESLRVTTAYRSDQVEDLIKTLTLILPIQASQTPMGVVLKPDEQ